MKLLNLGILAHVDAGKTSLTERLLHTAGVIDEIGSVDAGNTRTDSLDLERRRGITIKSAVVSFELDGVTVNLIDTPGHPDFIAEVERVLNVLDGAVLVVSAVEGVQAQTRVLMRTLRRLRIPTLLFVNKLDRGGADADRVYAEIAEKLTPAVVAMGRAYDQGTPRAGFVAYEPDDEAFATAVAEVLADSDDAFLAAYVDGDGDVLTAGHLRHELAARTARAGVHPVFAGSAITGVGIDALVAGIRDLLPTADGDPDAPASGEVFKVDRGPGGEKIAYVRMFDGSVHLRDRLPVVRPAGTGGAADGVGAPGSKVTGIQVFEQGAAPTRPVVRAGQIGRLTGLAGVRIGDTIGVPRPGRATHHFAPPTLETVVVPVRRSDKGALHLALTQLAEQDPLINLRQDDVRQELYVSLYGEVQKEVVATTLAEEYGIEVEFARTSVICVERPTGKGAAFDLIGTDPNPYFATVGLRVEPARPGSGVSFGLDVELGSMPPAFFTAVEETVKETLRQGLCGWEVIDIAVFMTHSGYYARQSHSHGTFDKSMSSTAGDFRYLTPLVLMAALRQAGTVVYEPAHRFHLECPADTLTTVVPALVRLGGVPDSQQVRGSGAVVEGEIPAARVHELQLQLPGLTRGEGMLDSAFERYQPVRGPAPTRARTDQNPLDRREYLRVVKR
ncbi:elongation factor G [Actinopolymorpha singaporensis]|uniref:Ribosomal protection tetracycline resistance protein n=1 Tax=Actinopolymorpha singaporensis TaxID=117157 RepID=A0A1H1VX98_9ACTN|nr:TetM/TetW/TetO/TetS family tetracycline resistance ribosomal protection protein [Actinopolymorpha singaporensis]SDS89383.1 ribosomal protection tetracycline resistance protein [Actinopolymorpha singaporensis]